MNIKILFSEYLGGQKEARFEYASSSFGIEKEYFPSLILCKREYWREDLRAFLNNCYAKNPRKEYQQV